MIKREAMIMRILILSIICLFQAHAQLQQNTTGLLYRVNSKYDSITGSLYYEKLLAANNYTIQKIQEYFP